MKTILLAVAALLFAGCASAPSSRPPITRFFEAKEDAVKTALASSLVKGGYVDRGEGVFRKTISKERAALLAVVPTEGDNPAISIRAVLDFKSNGNGTLVSVAPFTVVAMPFQKESVRPLPAGDGEYAALVSLVENAAAEIKFAK
jgi:hypothetical protein